MASIAFVTYGAGFWGPSFFLRVHGVPAGQVGTVVGLSAAVGGWLGVSLGGALSDRWKAHAPNGRLWVGLLAAVLSLPSGLVMLHTDSLPLAYALNFVFAFVSPLWLGAGATAVNELVLPRLRALASAFYLLRSPSSASRSAPTRWGDYPTSSRRAAPTWERRCATR
jgi:hypothetical protein